MKEYRNHRYSWDKEDGESEKQQTNKTKFWLVPKEMATPLQALSWSLVSTSVISGSALWLKRARGVRAQITAAVSGSIGQEKKVSLCVM